MKYLLSGSVALCCLTGFGAPVQAADSGRNLEAVAAQDQNGGAGIELVTVTARKRSETLIKTPVDEVAITARRIDQYQIHDLFGLKAEVPSLLIGTNSHAFGPSIFLRGIGANAPNPTTDESISLDVDGLSLTNTFAYLGAMFDVGQVEILKGPQSLFFGKNTTGGVISLRSADPTDETEVILRTGYETEAGDKFGEAIVSGAVSDSLQLRLAVHYDYSDGYFDNLDNPPLSYPNPTPPPATKPTGALAPTRPNVNQGDNWHVRGTALFTPSAVYDARLKLNYNHEFLNDALNEMTVTCPGGLVSFTGLPFFDPNQKCALGRDYYISYMDPKYFIGAPNGGQPFFASDEEYATIEQNVHLNSFTATSVTGFYDYHKSSYGNGAQISGMTPIAIGLHFANREFTEEARLASNFTDFPVNFMVGVFYLNGRMTNDPDLEGNTALGLPATLFNARHIIDIDSVSVFAQAIWNITNEIELSGGDRWTHETRDHTQLNLNLPGAPATVLFDPHIASSKNSPEATLTYRPTDDLTAFVSYKTGFKSGSFNTAVFYGPTTPTSFGDEEVKGEELGLKALLLDRRMALNIALYNYDYSGLQVGADTITPTGGIAIETLNAASANTRGVDLDLTYAPLDLEGLTLKGEVNYNAAHYISFPNAPCANNQTISQGCNQILNGAGAFTAQNLSGRPLAHAPKWTLDAGFDYVTPVQQDMTLRFGGDANYVTQYFANTLDLLPFDQGGYFKANANIALEGPDKAWEFALIVNNITDKHTTVNCTPDNENGGVIFGGQQSGRATGGIAGNDYKTCDPDSGREIWLRLTLRPLALNL